LAGAIAPVENSAQAVAIRAIELRSTVEAFLDDRRAAG
jgi:hypothetical protein